MLCLLLLPVCQLMKQWQSIAAQEAVLQQPKQPADGMGVSLITDET